MRKITVLYLMHDVAPYGGAALSLGSMIASLSSVITPIVVGPHEGAYLDILRRQGVKCMVCPFPLDYEYRRTFKVALALPHVYLHRQSLMKKLARDMACRLADVKIDIVHSNSSVFDFGYLLSRYLCCSHVWHIREFIDLDFGYKPMFGKQWLRSLLNMADARVVISKALLDHWRLRSDGTYVIGDGVVNKEDFVTVADKDRYVLFCAAAICEEKGAQDAIATFALSGLHRQGIRLLMAGACAGKDKEYYINYAKDHGVEDFVDFCGYQTDLRPLYRKAMALLMLSRCEGLGRVTLEAIANGCPVIARDTGGSLDIITHGVTGYLCSDTAAGANLLRQVVTADNTAITRNAQAFIAKNYSLSDYGQKISAVYNTVLK